MTDSQAYIGWWLQQKARRGLRFSGNVYQAARNLRKQGYPLHVALMLLVY